METMFGIKLRTLLIIPPAIIIILMIWISCTPVLESSVSDSLQSAVHKEDLDGVEVDENSASTSEIGRTLNFNVRDIEALDAFLREKNVSSAGHLLHKLAKYTHVEKDDSFLDKQTRDGEVQVEDVLNAYSFINTGTAVKTCSKLSTKRKVKKMILYNRIPKTGSRTLSNLIKELFLRHGMKFSRNLVPCPFTAMSFTAVHPERFIKRFMSFPAPLLFEYHVYFLDFTRYGCPEPNYINMLRDPFERLVSQYYYLRDLILIKNRTHFTMSQERLHMTFDECMDRLHWDCVRPDMTHLQLRFLCGHHPVCSYPSPASLARAVFNIRNKYLAVGHMSRMGDLVAVLERSLPDTMGGLGSLFTQREERDKKKYAGKVRLSSREPSARSREKIMPFLRYEYKIYNFVKAHFAEQYELVMGDIEK